MNLPLTASAPPLGVHPAARLDAPAIVTLDTQGVVIGANAAARDFWQRPLAQLLGAPFAELISFPWDVPAQAEAPPSPTETSGNFLSTAALERTLDAIACVASGSLTAVTLRLEQNLGTDGGYLATVTARTAPSAQAATQASAPGAATSTADNSALALLTQEGAVGFFDLNFLAGQIYYSPAWKHLLGYTDAELPNTYDSWLRLIHPEDSAAAPDQPPRTANPGTRIFSADIRMRHRRGNYVWVQCIGVQVIGPHGQLERATGVQIDLTERKELEEQTLPNEERIERLATRGDLALFDFDFARHQYWLSPAWERLLKTTPKHGAELDAFISVLPEDAVAPGLPAFFLKTTPDQPTFVQLVKLQFENGVLQPALIGGHRQLTRNRDLARVVGFCCPLPPEFDAVLDAPVQPELIDDILGAINEALLVADNRGQIVYLNGKAEQLLGTPLSEAYLRSAPDLFRLVHRSNGQPAENVLDLALTASEQRSLYSEHALARDDDTEPLPIIWSVHQCWTRQGAPAGLVVVFRDPEAMNLTPEEIVEASRSASLSVIAGGIAHDFNNLLTTILGGISQAKDHADSSHLANSERACLAAKALTKQLLSVSRGSDAAAPQVLSPAEILRDATRLAGAGSSAEIEVNADDEIAPICVNRTQILQVFQNLIINAVQALPAQGGKVSVRAANAQLDNNEVPSLPAGDYVRFEISDNGCGIDPEHLEKIFAPFFTTKKQGTGLGLATVQHIVRKHGGQIGVESHLGEGTTFRVHLPQADRPAEVEARRAPALPFGTGRVLFMDDDPDICHLVGSMLAGLDYKYDVARNGDEAITLYRRYLNIGRPYDLVMLDLTVIGGMGGEETFRQLYQLDPNIRAIVCSGYDNDEMAQRFLDLGFCGYLTKPFRMGDLGRVIKKVLG